jgi:hypothetical protein
MKNKLAFPALTIENRNNSVYAIPEQVYHPGMSYREWLAGIALQGMMCYGFQPFTDAVPKGAFDYPKAAIAMADALIEELNKK